MESVQKMVKRGCQEHGDHRQEEDAAEESIDDCKDCGRWRANRIYRSHASENHRGVQCRIQPGQVIQEVVTHSSCCDINAASERWFASREAVHIIAGPCCRSEDIDFRVTRFGEVAVHGLGTNVGTHQPPQTPGDV